MKMRRLLLIACVLLLVGCATTKPAPDPKFALQEFTITEEWSDGKVEKKFVRVSEEEWDLMTEIEKTSVKIILHQVGL